MRSCRTCRYAAPTAGDAPKHEGVCRLMPPLVVRDGSDGRVSGSNFIPVNLDTFVCGQYRRDWWKMFK